MTIDIGWVILGLLSIAGTFLGYFMGHSANRKKNERQKLKDYVDTRKRMDDVDPNRDSDDARSWLRKRGRS